MEREADRANLDAAVGDPVEDEVGAPPQQLTSLLRQRTAPPSLLPPPKIHASSPRWKGHPTKSRTDVGKGASAAVWRSLCSRPRIRRSSSPRIEGRRASPVRERRSMGWPRSPCLSLPVLDPCKGGRERAGAWGGRGGRSTPTAGWDGRQRRVGCGHGAIEGGARSVGEAWAF
jgi:hypothetical protein